MKRACIILLACILSIAGMAQSEADSALTMLAERSRLFGERIPQEKVYVQMDNTCYFLGDTIWFSAYTRRTNSGKPSKISRVLYSELWNHDGFLVERKLVEMHNGRGNGFFALPDTLYSGFFELRAYTRWQLNWGETEHPHSRYAEEMFYSKDMARDYFRDYEKLYSRVFPVYDKPMQPNEFVCDMTLRPLRRLFSSEPETPELHLSLFPEGGNLTAGLPCRVAFEATTGEGEAREGKVELMCNKRVIATAMTENRGRGTLLFTPETGLDYEAVFTSADGAVASQRLKDIAPKGVALQVVLSDSTWAFDVHSNISRPLGINIMHEGVTSHFEKVQTQGIRIPNNLLPAGVNQVTVFDEEGRVWADRLFFVTRPELTKPTLSVIGLKEKYEPYEEVKLDIRWDTSNDWCQMPTDGLQTTVSLAVRDVARSVRTFDTGNIMTEMLLASEIKGFIPQPDWFFERDDEEHRRALDLLMLTQGWRRFRWQDMALEGHWEMQHPAELSQVLDGNVNQYYSENMYRIVHDLVDTIRSVKDDIRSFMHGYIPYAQRLRTAELPPIYTAADADAIDQAQKHEPSSQRPAYRYPNPGPPKRNVRVHSEFVKPDAPRDSSTCVAETETWGGGFRLEAPRYYGNCIYFLSASDTTRWKKRHRHTWIQMEDDEYTRRPEEAEFYVRLRMPYPRWCKPYTFYQTHTPNKGYNSYHLPVDDSNTRVMKEIIVRNRRSSRRGIDLSKPVYVVDAYEAWNATMDAGLLNCMQIRDTAMQNETQFKENIINLTHAIAANYMGDMGGSDRGYDFSVYLDSIKLGEVRPYLAYKVDIGAEDPLEDHFVRLNFIGSRDILRQYTRLEYLDKIYIYSDFSPRNGTDNRLKQANQPSVEISLHKLPSNVRRLTYRDRRYILPGFAYQEDFYHPDYSQKKPEQPTDYRRTLYWNPDLRLDDKGQSVVRFWNNSQVTCIEADVQGMASNGSMLFNKRDYRKRACTSGRDGKW